MGRRKKTWTEKLNIDREPEVCVLDKPCVGIEAGKKLLVATPKVVEDYVRKIPKGRSVDVKTLRDDLARQFGADSSCPLSTGMYLRIIAEAANEQREQGVPLERIVPFWRVVSPVSPTAKKLTFGTEWLVSMRRKERIDA
jgi:hypothetical protein